MLALPCLWWLTVPLVLGYQLARTARRSARRIFPLRPEGHAEDPEVLRVQRVRAWTALVMSGALLAVFGDRQDVQEAYLQTVYRMLLAPWSALLIAASVVALLYGTARPGARQTMRTHLWPAGRSALWYFGAWFLVPLAFWAAFEGMDLLPNEFHGPPGLLLLVLTVALLFALWTPFWWGLFFLCFASGPALRRAFNLSAVHAALPALVTSVLVWALALLGLLTGGLPPGPTPLALTALLGGPLSVTAVSCWEIRRLRRG
ncbi:hypothetical protein HCC30_24825 [Streptomyces sp. HNM0574]|nr:hypothetical protein [Streptomyces sp. HNM0574]